MFVISLTDYTPIARYDNEPWTLARIEESVAQSGPWVEIDSVTLSPVDTDPANPQTRNFTTPNATLEEGWYRVVFVDGIGATETATVPVHRKTAIGFPFTPTVSEVAAILRARTKDTFGNEVGTFNSNTRPTGNEVLLLIEKAQSFVLSRADDDIPEGGWDIARDLISLGAAMLVEMSYFSEQVGTDRTAYEEMERMFDKQWDALIGAIEREKAEVVDGADAPPNIAFGFPTAEPLWTKKF